jgi:hypothetical protein
MLVSPSPTYAGPVVVEVAITARQRCGYRGREIESESQNESRDDDDAPADAGDRSERAREDTE